MRYLFVTGLPRSGTTAAARLLSWHPDCVVSYESHLVFDLLQMFSPNCGPGKVHHIATYWRGDTSEAYQWGSHHLSELLALQNSEVAEPHVALARAAVDGIADTCFGGRSLFVFKSPAYSREPNWRKVLQVIPEARFIIMDRPYDECLASVLRQDWGMDEELARPWLDEHVAGLEVLRRSGAPWDFYRLQHLVEAPEDEIAEMLHFAGLNPETFPLETALTELRETRAN